MFKTLIAVFIMALPATFFVLTQYGWLSLIQCSDLTRRRLAIDAG
jgi:hypothetical protein